MSIEIQRRRGTTAAHSSFTGAAGELTVDTSKNTVVVHDGSTVGGFPLPTLAAVSTKQAATYTPAGTGAVARTVESKLGELISVKDFGAVGNGVVDDTAAIQAAVNQHPGRGIYFPCGTYRLSAEILVSAPNTSFRGESRRGARLIQSASNAKVLRVSGSAFTMSGMSLGYSVTPAVGGTALDITGSYVSICNCDIINGYIGIAWHDGVAGKLTDFGLFDYEFIGLHVYNLNDLFVSRGIINAGNTTRGALGGIRLENKVEAFVLTDTDILLGKHSMTMEASVYGAGTRPAYNNFTNVFFDSAVNSVLITKCVETDFVGCWFSGGRSGGGLSGAVVANCQSIRFTSTRFFNCGSHGLAVQSTATDVTLTACKFESNSATAGAGVAHGLVFLAGATQFQVIGCTASNGLFTGTQGWGIVVNASCDNFIISECNLLGNTTGGLLDSSSTSADKSITRNLGYKNAGSGTGTVIVGQTVAAITHGLAITPEARNIDVGFSSSPTASGVSSLYVTAIGATTFQIVTNAAVVTTPLPVTWRVRP